MKTHTLIIMAILTFSGFASAQSTQKVILHTGQEKNVIGSKLNVKFISVVEDSRCPVGTNCVWAGNAKVKIHIGKTRGETKEFELNTNLDPKTVVYKGYQIKIVSLSPRPGENVKAMAAKNTAVFEITKIKH